MKLSRNSKKVVRRSKKSHRRVSRRVSRSKKSLKKNSRSRFNIFGWSAAEKAAAAEKAEKEKEFSSVEENLDKIYNYYIKKGGPDGEVMRTFKPVFKTLFSTMYKKLVNPESAIRVLNLFDKTKSQVKQQGLGLIQMLNFKITDNPEIEQYRTSSLDFIKKCHKTYFPDALIQE